MSTHSTAHQTTLAARARIYALALLCSATGCLDACEPPPSTWDAAPIELGVDDDLNAVLLDGRLHVEDVYIVGAGGLAAHVERGEVSVRRAGRAELRDITMTSDGVLFAVGGEGTIFGSQDLGATWEPVESGVTSTLHAVVTLPAETGDVVVAAGDEVVLVRAPLDGAWTPVAAPEGGWGRLLRLVSDGSQVFALGRGGVLWRSTAPQGPWTGIPTGTSADLSVAGWLRGETEDERGPFIVAGTGGTILAQASVRDGAPAELQSIETGVAADIVAFASGELNDYVLTADGRIFLADSLISQQELSLLYDVGFPARAMAFRYQEESVDEIGGGDHVLVVVGTGGRALEYRLNCVPWCVF